MASGFRKNGLAIARANQQRPIDCWRSLNQTELTAWYDSDASKGIDCAGESKLPPQSTYSEVSKGTIVHVLKARVKAVRGWHEIRNCMEVMLPCGEVVFACKNDFAPVD